MPPFRATGANFTDPEIPIEDLKSFVDDFPALLWRIEIARSRIEFLNSPTLPTLGQDARLFLKNMDFRKKILLPEDAPNFEAFMDAVKEGRTMATVFRVRSSDGDILWLKITGAVNSSDPRYYYGYLLDVNDTVDVIRGIVDNSIEPQTILGHAEGPAILADHESRRLVAANSEARELFGLPESGRGKTPLADLYPKRAAKAVKPILDDLGFRRVWSGRLEFLDGQGLPFTAQVQARFLTWRGRGMIRLALAAFERPTQINDHGSALSGADASDLDHRLEEALCLSEMLDQVMSTPAVGELCDGIIFSDIQARKNKVVVYGAGEPLTRMAGGEEFSYKGTIAEDIVRYGLDHLVVDETMDSIKPIDWALFIPCGLRSYYAKPFFERKVLRTVLILCCSKPDGFKDKGPNDFDAVLDPLAKAVKTWRKAGRAK